MGVGDEGGGGMERTKKVCGVGPRGDALAAGYTLIGHDKTGKERPPPPPPPRRIIHFYYLLSV